MTDVRPGDVICTRNPKGLPAFAIRLGAALLDRPNTVNHVIVVHHTDKAGTMWGIEARPGGVGWVNIEAALKAPYTIDNREQPKTGSDRRAVRDAVKDLLGTPYDWSAIVEAGMDATHVGELWAQADTLSDPPAHIICSALADYVYDSVGLASPGLFKGRATTPGDWAEFIIERGWLADGRQNP